MPDKPRPTPKVFKAIAGQGDGVYLIDVIFQGSTPFYVKSWTAGRDGGKVATALEELKRECLLPSRDARADYFYTAPLPPG